MQNFDAQWYLNNYKDVALSGMDPYQHYQKIGKLIGRHPMDPKKSRSILHWFPRTLPSLLKWPTKPSEATSI
ncbi:hypothetical protein ACSZNP_08085 [Aeromonas hydrophila]